MATIKPIEGRSIHQIQSGQVIVDLCSVVKELVENSLDAGATSLEVRFKNQGLDSIEVQDNGHGVSPNDYETIALKHYTSKLSTYDDLSSIQTFGFRGEALSSLCALSDFHIITARAGDGSKGTRLDFEVSGKLKNKTVVASQKGTTVAVENIFKNLPVRKRELAKNIKREYGKVLSLLHAYACISTEVKFAVSNQMPKGKKVAVFSTKANPTTKENIANVYGAKTLLALVPLDLKLEMQPTGGQVGRGLIKHSGDDDISREVQVLGHISRPVVGEGRQTPDRQMLFVNSRPCGLPQVSKAFNEVYKSYNVTQSPFIFANLKMDTNAYDVNVSPDKRTILLHDQTALLESLKSALVELFDSHDQSVPQGQLNNNKLPAFKPLTVVPAEGSTLSSNFGLLDRSGQDETLESSHNSIENSSSFEIDTMARSSPEKPTSLIRRFVGRDTEERSEVSSRRFSDSKRNRTPVGLADLRKGVDTSPPRNKSAIEDEDGPSRIVNAFSPRLALRRPVQDFNDRLANRESGDNQHHNRADSSDFSETDIEEAIPVSQSHVQKGNSGVIQNAFDRMRPQRTPGTTATITIGNTTTVTRIGPPESKRRRIHTPRTDSSFSSSLTGTPLFGRGLLAFSASGTQPNEHGTNDENDEIEEEDDDDEEFENDDENEDGDADDAQSASEMDLEEEIGAIEQETLDLEDQGEVGLEQNMIARDLRTKLGSSASNQPADSPSSHLEHPDSDDEYVDDGEAKLREEARVARLIADAEESAERPSEANVKRATAALQSRANRKGSTLQWTYLMRTSVADIQRKTYLSSELLENLSQTSRAGRKNINSELSLDSADESVPLTVSKLDFTRMRVIGQFNLGFILAIRPARNPSNVESDEMFIIDQHASDEKYNFERLQTETVVQNQRLVHPRQLELTAVEEEIILNHPDALSRNGFLIETDTSDTATMGRRCKIISLPMSREVVFDTRDLEELLALLADQAGLGVPRPSKVRKMFAMRACRSSIMVGKTLTEKQMQRVVQHMGEIDKPWNCPHGRPTMRHLYRMDNWNSWTEGDGLTGMGEEQRLSDWGAYTNQHRR